MIKIIKSGKTKQGKHFKAKCVCECVFEFYSEDTHIGSMTGKPYVTCPECHHFIYNEWFNWKKIK